MNRPHWLLRYIDLVLFALYTAFVISRRDFSTRFAVGMAIFAAGFSLWATARIQLGASFTVRPEAKKLVTHGLYSKIRNPIYLFGLIGYVGLFIAWGNWILLAIFLLLNSLQILRIKKEERVLEDAFGDEYRRYKASTWF